MAFELKVRLLNPTKKKNRHSKELQNKNRKKFFANRTKKINKFKNLQKCRLSQKTTYKSEKEIVGQDHKSFWPFGSKRKTKNRKFSIDE